MSRLDDILGGNKEGPKSVGQTVEIEITCEICYWPCDDVRYDKETKTLMAVCPSGHTVKSQIGLDFLVGE